MEKDKIIESLESRLSDLDEERQKIIDRLIQLEEEELKEKFHVNDCFIDVDTYMRQLKETKEWGRNLPYKKVNELLKEKVEVITYDMDKEPFERTFYPIGYDGNWITYLSDKLKNI